MSPGFVIGIMAKAPIAGYAKTRLIPLLGAAGAAALQRELTQRSLQVACAAAPGRVTLFAAGAALNDPYWSDCARRHGVPVVAQQGADLGLRMHHALGHLLRRDAGALLIGTDCPMLTSTHLLAAGEALGAARMVFIPAEDGGYVLVGASAPCRSAFENVSWGSDSVMQATRDALRRLSWQRDRDWVELETLADLDRPEDVARAVAAGWINAPAADGAAVAGR